MTWARAEKARACIIIYSIAQAGHRGPQASKCAGRGDIPVPRLLVGADAPNPGCFAAARPGGRLSLAAGAAVLLSIVVEE